MGLLHRPHGPVDRAGRMRAFLFSTALFLGAVTVWMLTVGTHLPSGSGAAQAGGFAAGYVLLLWWALTRAHRGTRRAHRLAEHGYEGWATVVATRPLQRPQPTGELTEITLRLVVPGAAPYAATMVRTLAPRERRIFRPGESLPIQVDPRCRERILLHPQCMPH